MRFVILAPHGLRTGGPEACLQLSDMLINHGFDAQIWLINKDDIRSLRAFLKKGITLSSIAISEARRPSIWDAFLGKEIKVDGSHIIAYLRANSIQEYEIYKTQPFSGYKPGEKIIFILPETYIWLVPLFGDAQVMIWWLSVDNAFPSLSKINLNQLRAPRVRHAAQSTYAKYFANTLGFQAGMLSDYTVINDAIPCPIERRPLHIAINAGQKVIYDLDKLSRLIKEQCPQAEIVFINRMSRQEVYDVFRSARLFIDLGNFPGKDRMAREALLLGSNIIIGNAGSAGYHEDFPISNIYRPAPHDLQGIANLAAHMVQNPVEHAAQFKNARFMVRAERETFEKEVLDTFMPYVNLESPPVY